MFKIAILGHGVVGSGTTEVFFKNKESIEKKLGGEVDVKYILDIRDFSDLPYGDRFVKDFGVILNDPEVSVAAELIGGLNPAYDFVKALLNAGKSVVTSNKELVAQKGAELLKTARDNGVRFFFEASVGGGIPIIRPLHQCLAANEIHEIAGILNGTTNFILTKMFRDGMGFGEALGLAQERGYAEHDPSDDVDGHDTCRKICILASLAFGKHVYPDGVYTEGIRGITREDVSYCENWSGSSGKGAVKLIGRAVRSGEKAVVMVCPAFVNGSSQLAGVDDVFNAILVRGDATGDVVFYGKGAGKYPTASAVVNDIVSALKNPGSGKRRSLHWEDAPKQSEPEDYGGLTSGFYLRIKGSNPEAAANGAFGDVAFLSGNGRPGDEAAFVTGKMSGGEFGAKLGALRGKAEILGRARVFDDL
ncbi:MAG: homoserine dehydrogenase [Oscillospiraceae bacterium]|jgi:homoserine dehydrogenase|nr:homoserine dehydrogenase [Oscillospiraceae bacterium]